MNRYICIHGHFYQPPRENPWLESIELQDSAYPYHDWNERITAQCYEPNTVSRILDGEGRIVKIINNYSKISFNFGPTLLAWLERHSPRVYEAILEADRESQKHFSGHGSALAQAYNHLILPLANRRDKYTQVLWGIRDFEHRFRRKPEGMWLSETAVDMETLDLLAELGLRFTVLAPSQARRFRRRDGRNWRDVSGQRIDPTRPYEVALPSGRRIAVFFYDGPISRAIAFDRLLERGENLAHRLQGAFREERDWNQLVHIATDGETYGHHHPHGEMALSYALHYIETNNLARLTVYGEYLDRQPPSNQVEIFDNSSWSCVHGVERWKSNCGCNSGGQPRWNQGWRSPLREALDWLRDRLAPEFEKHAGEFFSDPWKARNESISVVLDRDPENVRRFLQSQSGRDLNEQETVRALKLLELQRHLMLMYTSCGWFFDDLSGIETVQVIQYAGRAVQLGQELFGDRIEAQFLELLEKAKSNVAEHRDGKHIYEKFVKPAMVGWDQVGAHYAVSSLFENYPAQAQIYCYDVHREDAQHFEAGRARLLVGHASLTSRVTRESSRLTFGAVHMGDHNLKAGVREFQGEEAYRSAVKELGEIFSRGDLPEVLRALDRHFGQSTYSLRSLFRDEQRRTLNHILESSLEEAESVYRQISETHAPMMRFVTSLHIPLPKPFQSAAELVLNANLRRALESGDPERQRIEGLLEEARVQGVQLDVPTLEFALRRSLERLGAEFLSNPFDLGLLEKLEALTTLARGLPFEVNLYKLQNVWYDVLAKVYPEQRARGQQGDGGRARWTEKFLSLGEKLAIHMHTGEAEKAVAAA